MDIKTATIIGGGLAGSEAAWQLATRDLKVILYEMRPLKMTKAHQSGKLAELVCSNSFRGAALSNAVGLLKEELRRLSSFIMEAADKTRVPAGGALAVDREKFSAFIDGAIRKHPNITVVNEELCSLPSFSREAPLIVASGPLTSPALAKAIEAITGTENLAFFDAISPILMNDSLDHSKLFFASRYGKGDGNEYLNVPLSKEEYESFVSNIIQAEKFGGHEEVEADMIKQLSPFEGCMPIEDMAARGPEVLRYGPLKPVGLQDPRTGKRPYAALQLRTEDKACSMWNLVGMQTRMKHHEQIKIFRRLPGFENAEFARLGSVHRNTFIQSPKLLYPTLEMREHPGLFFAGQITGVEGYVESTAAGLCAGINAARMLQGKELIVFPRNCAIGALLAYISEPERRDFQPMNVSFALIESYTAKPRQKKESKEARRLECAAKALDIIDNLAIAAHKVSVQEGC